MHDICGVLQVLIVLLLSIVNFALSKITLLNVTETETFKAEQSTSIKPWLWAEFQKRNNRTKAFGKRKDISKFYMCEFCPRTFWLWQRNMCMLLFLPPAINRIMWIMSCCNVTQQVGKKRRPRFKSYPIVWKSLWKIHGTPHISCFCLLYCHLGIILFLSNSRANKILYNFWWNEICEQKYQRVSVQIASLSCLYLKSRCHHFLDTFQKPDNHFKIRI